MIISLKSKFSLFRHSEVLRLRRELRRKEQAWALERQKLIDAALTSRGGKPAFRELPPSPPKPKRDVYEPPGTAEYLQYPAVLTERDKDVLAPFRNG